MLIEAVCVVIFTIEYFGKFATVWSQPLVRLRTQRRQLTPDFAVTEYDYERRSDSKGTHKDQILESSGSWRVLGLKVKEFSSRCWNQIVNFISLP